MFSGRCAAAGAITIWKTSCGSTWKMAAEDAHRRGEPLRAASRTAQMRAGSALHAMDVLRDPAAVGLTVSLNSRSVEVIRLNAMRPGYFKTMGMALIGGRDFAATDSRLAPRVTIVNRAFARSTSC